ncbi:hypothetical protein SAMN05216323_102826 [Williamwhitmania taraxaci]|uniref:Uncharacterized protein n=1 Tax=Williamwhitmania taraxaci TaxID=1640674 RepID=A0A1G6L1N8_9BACT|nr:hypothetical protein SAMN05216323_102826 [Williamwhitmania taraxaci]
MYTILKIQKNIFRTYFQHNKRTVAFQPNLTRIQRLIFKGRVRQTYSITKVRLIAGISIYQNQQKRYLN